MNREEIKNSISEIEARIFERRNKNKKNIPSTEDYNPSGIDR